MTSPASTAAAGANGWSIARTFAFRELRGGIKGFRIFLACLALGVAAIAGAGSLNYAVKAGIDGDAQRLLGGDLQARLSYRDATAEEIAAMGAGGATVSYQVQLRSMARVEDAGGAVKDRTLIELKAVDAAYPLYGAVEPETTALAPDAPLESYLDQRDGRWGALIDPPLLSRLNVKLGDDIRVGEAAFEVRGTIAHEPDRVVTFATAGPRVMISTAALADTDLIQVGSLLTHIYNLRAEPDAAGGETAQQLEKRLKQSFPDAGWRLRGLGSAAAGLEGFLDNVTLFLTLVGMTALLTGGIGVANAVRAHMNGRINTIATLKCLGAPADVIFRMYTIQIGILSLIGVALGLLIGCIVPLAAGQAIDGLLPVQVRFGIYAEPLVQAAISGLLTAAVFALWPLARARDIPPVALFRNLLAQTRAWPRTIYIVALAVMALALGAYTVVNAQHPRYALMFVVGAAVSMVLFRFAAEGVMALARKLTARRGGAVAGRPTLRLALANLYRPGAPTTSVVLSLGLGLSVLVAIALLEFNLNARISAGLPKDAPSMFFIDIQSTQESDFKDLVGTMPGVHDVKTASMIRGRITQIKGVDVDKADIDPDARWVVRGERGVSTAATAPENASIVAGSWWQPDHSGDNLVSMDARAAEGLGIGIGDTISIDILGREITATIANLRDIRWQSGTMNFTLIYSPNTLAGAPGMYIATVNSDAGVEDAVEDKVLDAMPNVTVVQVRDAVEMVRDILGTLGIAVRITAAVALIAGALVLAGAIAAGHSRRIYESVVLKVLGATRGNVLSAFVFEYCLLGIATGAIAVGVGTLAAWAVIEHVMKIPWTMNYQLAIGVVGACIAVTLLAGFAGTWRALGIKAAPLLRNE